jgi:hypothetical protein
MSLDVSLYYGETCVFDGNITHNLGDMADAAGIYKACWRPEEIGVTTAGQLVSLLRAGLNLLHSDPARFKQYDSPNGWGRYENFVQWVAKYLAACEQHPAATISISR